jgi:hypothetical protein
MYAGGVADVQDRTEILRRSRGHGDQDLRDPFVADGGRDLRPSAHDRRTFKILAPFVLVIVDDATGDLDKKTQEAFYHKISSAKQIFCSFTEIPDNPLTQGSQIINVTAGRAV